MLHLTFALPRLYQDDIAIVTENIGRREISLTIKSETTHKIEWLVNEIEEKGSQSPKNIIYCNTKRKLLMLMNCLLQSWEKYEVYERGEQCSKKRHFEVFTAAISDTTTE